MNKIMALLIAFLTSSLLAFPATAADANQPPLQIGVVPYLSARILVKSYEPMRQYIEQALGMPVKIFTANSFRHFLQNAQQGEYDLVVAPAHFARLLQKDQKFSPLVRYAKGGRGLVMVTKDSNTPSLENLKGKTIAVPFRLSLASIICVTALHENGLIEGKNISITEYPSFESAILAVKNGEAAAAVSAPGALAQINAQLRETVVPVLDTGEYVNLIFMTHPRMDAKTSGILSNILIKFGKSTEGKEFFSSTGFGEFLPVSSNDMHGLDKYLPITRQLLEESK